MPDTHADTDSCPVTGSGPRTPPASVRQPGIRVNTIRRLCLILLFVAALLPCDGALAQGPTAKPPEVVVNSPGGVDMTSGQYRDEHEDLSIGAAAAGGITYQRAILENPINHAKSNQSNWYIVVFRQQNSVSTTADDVYSVVSTGYARSFSNFGTGTFVDVGFNPDFASFASVAGGYVLTEADGTTITFGPLLNNLAVATSVVHPDGSRYLLAYDNGAPKRLKRVSSNSGYQLILEYAGASTLAAKACVINAAATTPPASDTCPAGGRSVAYAYDTAGRLTATTDVNGDTRSVVYAGSSASYYKPGLSQPYVVNMFGVAENFLGPVVTAQHFAGGRSIDYSYMTFQPDEGDTGGSTLGAGRGAGWTENGVATTSLMWGFRQAPGQGGTAAPWFVSPAPIAIDDPLGRVTQNSFTGNPNCCAFGSVASHTLPSGRSESYGYGQGGLGSRLWTAAPGSGDAAIAVAIGHDCTVQINCFKPSSITDANGNTTDYTYDSVHGGVLTETRPAPTAGAVRPQKRYTYGQFYAWYRNSAGTLVQGATPLWLMTGISECRTLASCAGTADETLTTVAYGVPGTPNNLLPTAQTVAAGDGSLSRTTSWTYDADGNKLTEDGPAIGTADTTRWRYDDLRRVVGQITPDPDGAGPLTPLATRNSYDPAGRLIRVDHGTVADQSDAAWAAFSVNDSIEVDYDLLDRKIAERRVAGGTTYTVTQYSYDVFGRLSCTAVRMNPAAFATLPADACTLGTAGAQGPDRIEHNVYDLAGQLLTVQRAYGTPLQQDYATYGYAPDGQRASVIDANGNLATYGFDGHDRQTRWTFPSKTVPGAVDPADYEGYGYDANGNRTGLRRRDGRTLTFVYDALDRVMTKLIPDGCAGGSCPPAAATRDVYYGYDLQGHQTLALFDSLAGEGIANGYDALGQLTATTSTMGGASRTLGYGYDAHGERTRVTWPDAIALIYYRYETGQLLYTESDGRPYFYTPLDAMQRLAGDLRWRTGVSWGHATGYGYDAIGRVSALNQNFVNPPWNTVTTLSYNPASQIVEQGRSNEGYAYTGYVATSRAYATNGLNQYTTAGAASLGYDANGNLTSDGTTSYLYDAENRLIGASTGVTLDYDPLGRLWRTSTAAGVTQFLYDGSALVAEYDGAGTMLRRYFHGDGDDDPQVMFAGASLSAPTYLFSDQQGSVVALADEHGFGTAVNSYDAYGTPAAGNTGRFQYTGQAWMSELGLYYYKARFYSPALNRFLQVDPVGYADQVNLYAYVANDPVNGRDPTGMCTTVWNCLTGGVFKQADGTVKIESSVILRTVVPGQVAWDNARTAWANGDKAGAVRETAVMAAHIGVTVATAGMAVEANAAGRVASSATRTEGAAVAQGPRFARGDLREQVMSKGRQADGTVNCSYCGRPTATTSDHVVPYSKGGPTSLGNLEPACIQCNASKGAKDLGSEWIPPNQRNPN